MNDFYSNSIQPSFCAMYIKVSNVSRNFLSQIVLIKPFIQLHQILPFLTFREHQCIYPALWKGSGCGLLTCLHLEIVVRIHLPLTWFGYHFLKNMQEQPSYSFTGIYPRSIYVTTCIPLPWHPKSIHRHRPAMFFSLKTDQVSSYQG